MKSTNNLYNFFEMVHQNTSVETEVEPIGHSKISGEDQSRYAENHHDTITSESNNFKYRTLDIGTYKMFFTFENSELVYKFI